MCALKPAFVASSIEMLMAKIRKGQREQRVPSSYSIELRGLISKLFATDSKNRPSAREVLLLPFLQKHIADAPATQCGQYDIPDGQIAPYNYTPAPEISEPKQLFSLPKELQPVLGPRNHHRPIRGDRKSQPSIFPFQEDPPLSKIAAREALGGPRHYSLVDFGNIHKDDGQFGSVPAIPAAIAAMNVIAEEPSMNDPPAIEGVKAAYVGRKRSGSDPSRVMPRSPLAPITRAPRSPLTLQTCANNRSPPMPPLNSRAPIPPIKSHHSLSPLSVAGNGAPNGVSQVGSYIIPALPSPLLSPLSPIEQRGTSNDPSSPGMDEAERYRAKHRDRRFSDFSGLKAVTKWPSLSPPVPRKSSYAIDMSPQDEAVQPSRVHRSKQPIRDLQELAAYYQQQGVHAALSPTPPPAPGPRLPAKLPSLFQNPPQ